MGRAKRRIKRKTQWEDKEEDIQWEDKEEDKEEDTMGR